MLEYTWARFSLTYFPYTRTHAHKIKIDWEIKWHEICYVNIMHCKIGTRIKCIIAQTGA